MAPVHDAAERDDVEELRSLLDADPGLTSAEDWSRRQPLHRASRGGAVEAARLLLDRGDAKVPCFGGDMPCSCYGSKGVVCAARLPHMPGVGHGPAVGDTIMT